MENETVAIDTIKNLLVLKNNINTLLKNYNRKYRIKELEEEIVTHLLEIKQSTNELLLKYIKSDS